MGSVTKAIKFLLLGDDKSAVSALRNTAKEMKNTAKSGGGLKGLGKDLKAAFKTDGIKGVGGVLKNAGKEAGGLGGMVGKVGIGLAATGAAAVAAGAAIAIKFGADSISTFKRVAAETMKLSRVTGLTTEDASRLGFAFQQTGVDVAKGTQSFALLGKNLSNASDGGKKAAAMAKLLGFNFTDAHGKVLPMAQLIPKLADKFSSMPDGAEKSALAMKMFGKSGVAMLPFLNKGAKGLDELAKKSDKYGATLSGPQLDALKKSKAAQREWDAAMQGLQVTLGSELLPMVTDFAVGINNALIPAITWLTGEIKKNQAGFDALGNGMKWLWNNILMPVLKFMVFGMAQFTAGIGYAIAALGHLTGNKDMETFGNGVVSAAEDVEKLAMGMKGVDYTVTPTVDAKTEEAKKKVKEVDKSIKGIKDKIVTAKAKGDTKGLDKLNAQLKAAEAKKHALKVKISAYLDGGTDQIRLNINRGGKTGVMKMYRQGGRPRVGEPAIFHQDEIWQPDTAGTVISQSRSRQIMRSGGPMAIGGGGATIIHMTVNVPLGADTLGPARAIRAAMVNLHAKTGLKVP